MPTASRLIARTAAVVAAALSALLLGVAFLTPGVTSTPTSEAQAAADRSVAEARGTVRYWAERVEVDGRDFVAQEQLAVSLLRRFSQHGDPSHLTRAHEAAASAVELAPVPSSSAHIVLSAALGGIHEFEAAEQSARQATELRPGSAAAWVALSDALAALGRIDQARVALDSSLRGTSGLETYARRAVLAAAAGDLDEARLAWRLAFADTDDVRPEDLAWALAQRGAFERASGEPDRARGTLRAALSTYPYSGAAAFELARVEAELGDLEASQRRLEDLVRRQPSPRSALLLLEVSTARGDSDAADTAQALVAAIAAAYEAAGINSTPSALVPGGLRS